MKPLVLFGILAGFAWTSAQAGVLYDNTPYNPSVCCSYGFGPAGSGNVVSDSFALKNSATVTGFDFFDWLAQGDSLLSVDWSIGSSFGDSNFGSGTAAGAGLSASGVLLTGSLGAVNLALYRMDVSGLDTPLSAGSYWLSLSNGTLSSGTYVSWDTYAGSGCGGTGGGAGCPASAVTYNPPPGLSWHGIPSEAFDITGGATAAPESGSLVLFGGGLMAVSAWRKLRVKGRWSGMLWIGLCTAGLSHAGIINGLVAYYPFDGNGNDASGNGYNLTVVGNPGFVPGRFGEAMSLNGTGNQYATRPVSDPAFNLGASDFTLQIWVDFNSHPGEQTLIEKFSGCCGPGWTLTTPGDLQFYDGGANNAAFTWADHTWYDVVVRDSSNALDFFVNGSLLGSFTLSAGSSSPNPLLIGRRNSGDGRVFPVDGLIDDVAIWNRALSNSEIAYLASNPVMAPEPGTLAMCGLALIALAICTARTTAQRQATAAIANTVRDDSSDTVSSAPAEPAMS